MPSQWTQNDISINGAKLHYYRTGDGSLPALVLQHGFSDNGWCWSVTAQALEARYDIVMPDARGHGLSARVQPGEDVDTTADLTELIRSLGLERPIVAGHSMGASIASQLGARFPDVARALVLEDPPWRDARPQPPAENAVPFDRWFREMAELTVDEIVKRNRAEHPNWPEDVLRTWCAAKKQLDLNFFSVVFAAPLRLARHRHRDRLPNAAHHRRPGQGRDRDAGSGARGRTAQREYYRGPYPRHRTPRPIRELRGVHGLD